MNSLWTLALAGLLYGGATMWIFRRTANGPAILSMVKRIQAHLLEFWLFVDEPRAIWKSWKGLLAANGRLFRLVSVPFLLVSIPSVPLFLMLDAFYGTSPLRVGKRAGVPLAFAGPPGSVPNLRAPDWISVESPPVRVSSLREVSWRIRPMRPLSGELQWVGGGTKESRRIPAGDGLTVFGWKVHWSVWFLAFSVVGAIGVGH